MEAEGSSAERLGEIEAGLVRGLRAALPGVEVLDRALQLPGGARADLVALDEAGRLLLVLVVDGSAEGTSLAALDLLAQARSHLSLIARHLARPRLRADLEPRLALVAESYSDRTRSRLAPLTGERLLLFELRELASARHASVYLVALPAPPLASLPRAADAGDFLAGLSDEARALAGDLLRRFRRMDEGIECVAGAEDIQWRYRGRSLAGLRRRSGRLEGHLPLVGEALMLESGAAGEAFLERALEHYLQRSWTEEDEEEAEELELAGLGPDATRTRDREPLLSAEELEAFRE